MNARQVVVTGAAGFIGSHLSEALLDRGVEVTGIDAFTSSYTEANKRANVAGLLGRPGFRLVEDDLSVMDIDPLLAGVDVVFHQAARAGVRSSWGLDFDEHGEGFLSKVRAHGVAVIEREEEAQIRQVRFE